MALDQGGAVPLAEQIRTDLLRRIVAGQYALGEKIPSLRTLAAEYEVAELTVHSAVRQLQHEGVLESSTGRGTFVRAMPSSDDAGDEGALTEAVADLRAELTDLRRRVELLEAERES